MPWLLRMTLLVSGIMAVAHLYIGWRMTKATGFISSKKTGRWLPLILLASFYTLPVYGIILYAMQGQVDVLEIAKPITYWFWFGFAFTYQLVTWIILLDLVKIGFHLGSSFSTSSINRWYGRAMMVVTMLILLFTGYKVYRDTTHIGVQNMQVEVAGLPDALNKLRIVHISDIQGDQYTGPAQIARYVEKINSLEPDLVIFTGDLISYGTDYITMAAEEFSKANAKYGIYAVVGDHDYWAGLSNVKPALEQRGIDLIEDENRIIDIGANRLLLTGVTQVYSQRARPEIVKELTSATDTVSIKILASHQVSDLLLREAQENHYHLMLAGHTHGGQVRVPLFGQKFSASDLETDFVGGLYQRGDLLININNGLGFTLAPVRYNAPPTVTLIELSGSQSMAHSNGAR